MPAHRARLPAALLSAPFTTEEAREAGVGRGALRGRAVVRLARGVYVAAGVSPSLRVEVGASLRVLPADAVASSVTALQLLGLDLGPQRPLRFTTTARHQVRRPGMAVTRVARLPPHRGQRVAPLAAWCGAGTLLDLVDLVAAGDWLVRRGKVTVPELVDAAAAATGRGSAQVRRAARLVRERVDSVRESRLRLLLVLAGLPEPECNLAVGSNQRFIATVDLLCSRWRVVLEYEGDQHRSDRRQWNHDIGRYDELAQAGFTVIRVTAETLRRPRLVVARVDKALRAAGYAGPSPTFSTDWSRLFE